MRDWNISSKVKWKKIVESNKIPEQIYKRKEKHEKALVSI
jgi:hypothetical protein